MSFELKMRTYIFFVPFFFSFKNQNNNLSLFLKYGKSKIEISSTENSHRCAKLFNVRLFNIIQVKTFTSNAHRIEVSFTTEIAMRPKTADI